MCEIAAFNGTNLPGAKRPERFLKYHLLFALMIVFMSDSFGQLVRTGGQLFSGSFIPIEDYTNDQGEVILFSHAIPVLNQKITGSHLVVSLVDSGILPDHPQLEPFILEKKDFTGTDMVDRIGHGTSVAIAQLQQPDQEAAAKLVAREGDDLMAPIGIYVAKVVDKKEDRLEMEKVIEAIDWSAKRGVDIINLSLGFIGERETYQELCEAIRRYDEVLFMVAAGNYEDYDVFPACCKKLENMMVVGDNTATSGKCATIQYDLKESKAYAPIPKHLYYYNLAGTLAVEGNVAEAEQNYQKSLSVEPNFESYYQLGVIYLGQKKYQEAKKNLENALELHSDFPEALFHLGAYYHLVDNYELAQEHYLAAIEMAKKLELDELVPSFYRNLINLNFRFERFCRAFEYCQQALPLLPYDGELPLFTAQMKARCLEARNDE